MKIFHIVRRILGGIFIVVGFLGMTRMEYFWYGAGLFFIGIIFIAGRE